MIARLRYHLAWVLGWGIFLLLQCGFWIWVATV